MLSRCLVLWALVLAACTSHAQGTLFKVPTRDGVVTTLFWKAAPDAKATVFLFPGGGGGFGKVEDGKATGGNFLVRSEPFFVANGFNVAIFGRPSDSQDLDYADRISDTHMADVRQVLDFVKRKADVPVVGAGVLGVVQNQHRHLNSIQVLLGHRPRLDHTGSQHYACNIGLQVDGRGRR